MNENLSRKTFILQIMSFYQLDIQMNTIRIMSSDYCTTLLEFKESKEGAITIYRDMITVRITSRN